MLILALSTRNKEWKDSQQLLVYKMLSDDKDITKILNIYKNVHVSDVFSLEINIDKVRK